MSAMKIEPLRFCHVHGYVHPDGEMQDVDRIPPEFFVHSTDPDAWDSDEATEDCIETEWADVIVLDPTEFSVKTDEPVADEWTFHAGDLAYFDTGSVLVPCKVRSINGEGAEVMLTATRDEWRKGQVLHVRSPRASLVNRQIK
jgi:hypothetical protein